MTGMAAVVSLQQKRRPAGIQLRSAEVVTLDYFRT
jgi:hypothetical protein